MAYPDNLLARGERVVMHKHPHWKVLVLPTIFFIVIIAGGSFFAAWVNKWKNSGFTTHLWWFVAISVVGVVLLLFLCLVPFLRWRTEHFVLTTQHVFFRTGILHRREHQIPLSRIQNIETVVTFWGRILSFGSLIVDSAADQPLEFSNVASLTKVQSTLNQLVADDRDRFGEPMDSRGRAVPRPTEAIPDDRYPRGGRDERDDDDRPERDYDDRPGRDYDDQPAPDYDDRPGRPAPGYPEQSGYSGPEGDAWGPADTRGYPGGRPPADDSPAEPERGGR
ncbi:MAG TPA: PH domain-containing protein [Nakamurella sp.]|nr:PH domain-containing protein [Nakamurella sp.]